jgi:hypothetical protein
VTREKSFALEPLKVDVRPNKTRFYVSKETICAESEFFEAACKEVWLRDNTITFAEDEPTSFGVFLVWLSTRNIEDSDSIQTFSDLCDIHQGDIKDVQNAMVDAQFQKLVKCFILGDSLQSIDFCNSVMDFIIGFAWQCLEESRLFGITVGVSNFATKKICLVAR